MCVCLQDIQQNADCAKTNKQLQKNTLFMEELNNLSRQEFFQKFCFFVMGSVYNTLTVVMEKTFCKTEG